jgi:hypothetical protein
VTGPGCRERTGRYNRPVPRGKQKSREPAPVVQGPGPRWLRIGFAALGALYLLGVVLRASGVYVIENQLPRPVRYFSQIACLFPRAVVGHREYRVTGFSCEERSFHEIDTRPLFPVHPDDKENRLYRLFHFYQGRGSARERRVMQALDEYVVRRHNERVERGDAPGEPRIGGIRATTVQIPLPARDQVKRYRPLPIADYPPDQVSHRYRTPRPVLRDRCREDGT